MLIFKHINRELENGELVKVPIRGMTIVHTYYIIISLHDVVGGSGMYT